MSVALKLKYDFFPNLEALLLQISYAKTHRLPIGISKITSSLSRAAKTLEKPWL